MTGQGQQAIPVPPAPTSGNCAWCGTRTSLRIVLERRFTGVRRKEIAVWCCATHQRTLARKEGSE